MGLRPLLGPPCIPPEAPPKKRFQFPSGIRGQRVSCCGSFPPSLRSLRRSPSAKRKCQRTLSLWSKSASAKYHNAVRGLNDTRCSPTPHVCPQFRQVLAFPGLSGLFPAALPNLPTILRNNRFLQLQVAFRVDPITTHTSTPSVALLSFNCRHQKQGVELPSLNSSERMRRRWLVLSEFAKYAFFWPDKEKSCF